MEPAVAFCIYNRPEPARKVFEAIRREQPRRLFVIGDGPNPAKPDDHQRVEECRELIQSVDWDCSVETCLAEQNLGCRQRMGTGLTWAFERAEAVIVLEDDCLPGEDFFPFMNQMLERHADDSKVMMISGDNFQSGPVSPYSYYYSRWTHIWGWASWKRAWQHFDDRIDTWPTVRSTEFLNDWTCSAIERNHWQQILDQLHLGRIDSWDFLWMYACWLNKGLTVLPSVNLVSNIGFGSDATHTTDPASKLADMPARKLGPLQHPPEIERNAQADQWTWENVFLPGIVSQEPLPKLKSRIRFWPFGYRSRSKSANGNS